jgi:hypothetical protein
MTWMNFRVIFVAKKLQFYMKYTVTTFVHYKCVVDRKEK